MDFKDDSNVNRHSICSNDSNHDSDIESRLYAEIYFSNTIEGEDGSANSMNNNGEPSSEEIVTNNVKDIDNFVSNEENLNHSIKTQNNSPIVKCSKETEKLPQDFEKSHECNDTVEKPESSNVQAKIQENKSLPNNNQNMNTAKSPIKLQKSSKRSLVNNDCSNELFQISNKRSKFTFKDEPNGLTRSRGENSPNSLIHHSDNSTLNSLRNEIRMLQKDSNKVINPCANKSRGFMELLSPEFFKVFFNKKTANKKPNKQLASKNNLVQTSNQNQVLQSSVMKKNTEVNIVKNKLNNKTTDANIQQNKTKNIKSNVEQCITSEIIELSSESSSDSSNVESKYSVTQKQFKQKNSVFTDKSSEDSTYDSDASICEVPVPRKPTPPLIDLKDSENENDSDNSSNSSNSFISHKNDLNIQNKTKDSLYSLINTVNDVNYESNEESNEIILNCTKIQNHVSSLSEIKRLSQLSNTTTPVKENNTVDQNFVVEKSSLNTSATANLVNKPYNLRSQTVKEKVSTPNKVTNTLDKKQRDTPEVDRQPESTEEYFFQPMTEEMKSFYNKSWGGEDFDMDQLRSKMSTDPNKWAVLDKDILFTFNQRKRYFGVVCNRCEKVGHKHHQCPQQHKSPICHMCGGRGHFETSCCHKKCLTCGRKQNMYRKTCDKCRDLFCKRCGSQGHAPDTCPDLWRRYHQTTSNHNAEPPMNLSKVMKPQHQLFCCNCARKGHDSNNCKKYRWSQHFSNPAYVSNYNGPDYVMEQYDLPETIDETQADSINLNMTNNNPGYDDFTSDGFEILNTTSNNSINFCHSTESNNERLQNTNSSKNNNSPDPMTNRINTFSIKSKGVEANKRLKNLLIKTKVTDKKAPSNLDDWEIMFKFLEPLRRNIPINFNIKKDRIKMEIYMDCPAKYVKRFKNIFDQYISRSNAERSCMFFTWKRNPQIILNKLSNKIKEMKTIKDCPLDLYEEKKQLVTELKHIGDKGENDLGISLLKNKLFICQKKLLMALYKEGFMDNSYKHLLEIHKKIIWKFRSKSLTYSPSFICLLEYIYNYNNVFIPYEPKNLVDLMRKYKEHIEMANRIRNDPLLTAFGTENTVPAICDQLNETIVITEDDNEVGSYDKNQTALLPPQISANVSVIPPLIPDNISVIPPLISANISVIPPLIPDNISVIPPLIPANALPIPSRIPSQPQTPANNFRTSLISIPVQKNIPWNAARKKYQKEDRQNTNKLKAQILIAEANKLNAPQLKKHIKALQKRLDEKRNIGRKSCRRLRNAIAELQYQK